MHHAWYSLEYQQNYFSLHFCPSYTLPIWLHITSADISVSQLMLYRDKLEDCKKDKTAD